MNDEHEIAPEPSDELIGDLRALDKRQVFVPPAVDEQVLAAARTHLEPVRRAVARRRPVRWIALAASIAILATVAGLLWRSTSTSERFVREDVNRDGRVDILDAFTLAQLIESGGTLKRQWDINGDGAVDRRDVESIAARAVRLDTIVTAEASRPPNKHAIAPEGSASPYVALLGPTGSDL